VLTVEEGPTASRNVVQHPVDAFLHLSVREAVAIERGHVQKLDTGRVQGPSIVLCFKAAVHHSGDATLLEAFDLAVSERAADGQLRSDF
jgi:hypothetical protein